MPILILDLFGTFVFGAEGAMSAIAARLDPLGVMVIAFATALAGGLTRDLLIGAVPPNCIRDWRYAVVAFSAGGVVLAAHRVVAVVPPPLILTLDAAGLSLFAVAGTEKALAYRIPAFIAVLMGAITGAGGGIVRDLLLNEVPRVLRTDIYAVAAMAGSTALVLGLRLGLPAPATALLGAGVCFAIRMLAVWQHWNLPILS